MAILSTMTWSRRKIGLMVLSAILLWVVYSNVYNPFLDFAESIRVGQGKEEVLSRSVDFEKFSLPVQAGGEALVVTGRPFEAEERKSLELLSKSIETAEAVPYLYADVVIAFGTDDRVIGYSWDGEGPTGGIYRDRRRQ